jgi:RNase H-like domain found in reverse transcriptase/Reverse transcriptase (RNA-dependent DNA polymerase)/Integrase zinc binding domain/Chromo (CHRromatin Organisation MOdifier) domain
LLDSGATGNFIDTRTAQTAGFRTIAKENPYGLFLVDGDTLGSNDGMVTHETELLSMKVLGGHTEKIMFDLVRMETHKLILGMPWLRLHNPQIDWVRGRITINQCRCRSNRTVPTGIKRIPPQERIFATSQEDNEYHAQDSVSKQIPIAYKEYQSLFREAPLDERALPESKLWDHEIPIEPGKTPPFGPIYQLSEKELGVLKDYIEENLKKGFIRPSNSPAGSPILFVPKKDGTLRLCVDYRKLNNITIKDRYALPLVPELQDRLCEARIFTSLDLRGAYNLIRMKEGEEWKTAFRTKYGLYEYRVMPFGLTNAPATCQRMINDLLREYLDVFVVAYLDDILVYSKTETEHTEHVRKVLGKLQYANLLLKPEKCEFHKTELEFLGYIIGQNGIRMSPKKIQAVRDWPIPGSVKAVQAFLGFANFCRKFIEGYSMITQPLTDLTKKEQAFTWTKEAQKAFETLKEKFTTAPILTIFDPEKAVILETDASDYAIGACLGQHDDQGQTRPVAYYSRKLTSPERNYDVHDKELLAIVEAFKQWRVYLHGTHHRIQVYTDHKNLTAFTTTKILNRRQVRWSEELSEYNFVISYRRGQENGRADALSRREDYDKRVRERPRALLKTTESGLEYNMEILATISTVENDTLAKQIKEAYDKDECAQRILKAPQQDFGQDQQGLLRFKGLVYIPANMRLSFTREQHSLPAHGHQGISRTFDRVSKDYYFPKMRNTVEKVVTECDICNRAKTSRHAPYGLLQPLAVPKKAWTSISMDFITKLPVSKEPMTGTTFDAIWVVVDRLTKYGYFVPYKESSSARELVYMFTRIVISQHGLPEEIISDRDKLFVSKFWKTMMNFMGTHHKTSTAYHPQTDGQTERLNQTLEQYLRCYVNEQQDNWVELLPLAQFAHNSAKNQTTGTSPFFANYGYEPEAYRQPRQDETKAQQAMVLVEKLQGIHHQLARDIEFNNQRMQEYANKHRITEPSMKRGDKVYLLRKNIQTQRPSNKLDFKKVGPFEILEVIGRVNYKLKLPEKSRLHPVFHVSLLEPAKGQTPDAMNTEIQPINEEQEYEVEKILDQRISNGKHEYLVKWKDYEETENSWEPTEHLNCDFLVKQFHRQNPTLEEPARRTKKDLAERQGPEDQSPRRTRKKSRSH